MIKLVVGRNVEQLEDPQALLTETGILTQDQNVEQFLFPEHNLHPGKHYQIVNQIVNQHKQHDKTTLIVTHSNTIHVYASTLIRTGVLNVDEISVVMINDNNDNTKQFYFRTDGLMSMDWFGKGFWTTQYDPNDFRVCDF